MDASAHVPEIPGCMNNADRPEEALTNVLGDIRTRGDAVNELDHAIPVRMWYSESKTAQAVAAIPGSRTQAGPGQGAGERLEGYGPDRK